MLLSLFLKFLLQSDAQITCCLFYWEIKVLWSDVTYYYLLHLCILASTPLFSAESSDDLGETHICPKFCLIPGPLWFGFLEQLIEAPGLAWIDALKSIIKLVFLSTYAVPYTVPFLWGFPILLERHTCFQKTEQQPGARGVLQALRTERAHSCQVWKMSKI